MFRHRFETIRQRLLRHELFSQHKLTTVESLLGVTGRKARPALRWKRAPFSLPCVFARSCSGC